MLQALKEWIQKDFRVVSKAPRAFVFTLIIAIGLAYLGVQWRYAAVIDSLKGRILILEERLRGKENQPVTDLLAEREKERARQKQNENRLKKLTPKEKDILRYYVEKESMSQYVKVTKFAGELGSLSRDKIIYFVKEGPSPYHLYNIEVWAYEYLREYPELVTNSTL